MNLGEILSQLLPILLQYLSWGLAILAGIRLYRLAQKRGFSQRSAFIYGASWGAFGLAAGIYFSALLPPLFWLLGELPERSGQKVKASEAEEPQSPLRFLGSILTWSALGLIGFVFAISPYFKSFAKFVLLLDLAVALLLFVVDYFLRLFVRLKSLSRKHAIWAQQVGAVLALGVALWTLSLLQ